MDSSNSTATEPADVLGPDLPEEPDVPAVRLSKRRVLAALLAVGLVGAGVASLVTGTGPIARARPAAAAGVSTATWFAPYVDTTLTPTLQFQDPAVSPARQIVLGFVVADHASPCTPSWGGFFSLDGAGDSLDLDRRVKQVQAQGGSAVVSFGGQANTELASGCTDVDRLTAAYQSVVSRYDLHTVDLDLEGAALQDTASGERRARAVAALQRSAAQHGRPLRVWLTLPVDTDGLQGDALAVVRAFLAAGVDLAGVNVMTMDFRAAPDGMPAAVTSALQETHRQLTAVYRSSGTRLSSEQVWRRTGATVMIGQNDAAGQILSIPDAQAVAAFATAQGLGRLSMWSQNRDSQCGAQFARVGVHSLTCSGTAQTHLGFSQVFSAFTGSVDGSTEPEPSAGPAAAPGAGTAADDPAHSPFPVWSPEASYPSGYKVVREGNVYQAKWVTSMADPAADAADPGQTPWRVVGPVLPTDRPPVLPTMAPGTHPDWDATTAYRQGEQVLRDGLPYQAKYYTQGDDPAAVLLSLGSSPWRALYTVPGEPAPVG